MKILIAQSCVVDRKQLAAGETCETSEAVARLLIGMGKAIEAGSAVEHDPGVDERAGGAIEDARNPLIGVEQTTLPAQRKKK
jgi:hypothetical protein